MSGRPKAPPAAAAAAAAAAGEPRPRTGVEGSEPSAPEAAAICSAVGLYGMGWQKPPHIMAAPPPYMPPGVPGCDPLACSMLLSEPPLLGLPT